MENIQFEEDQDINYNGYRQESRGLVGLIIKLKLAKDEQSANKVLMIIGIVAVILMIIVIYSSSTSKDDNFDPNDPGSRDPGAISSQ